MLWGSDTDSAELLTFQKGTLMPESVSFHSVCAVYRYHGLLVSEKARSVITAGTSDRESRLFKS